MFRFRLQEARHTNLVDRVAKVETHLVASVARKLSNNCGDVEVMIGEALDYGKRTLEDTLRRILQEERRSTLYSNEVQRSVRLLNSTLASSSSSNSWTPSRIFRSSSSGSSSVFNTLPGISAYEDDQDVIEAFETEGVRIAKAMNEVQEALERIKTRIGEKFE